MRIAVASGCSPFEDHGSRRIVEELVVTLRAREHAVEEIWLPVDADPERLTERMLAARLTDVSDAGDLLIAVRPPSHLLEHPNKVVWFESESHPPSEPGRASVRADQAALSQARRTFATSEAAMKRLRDSARVDADVLYPALSDPRQYRWEPPRDYVLMLDGERRSLANQAMQIIGSPIRLESADGAGLERRASLIAAAVAVLHLSHGEVHGYAALESFQSAKPIIVAADAGVSAELAVDAESGFIVEPTAGAIARAVDELARNPALAWAMGRHGAAHIDRLGITADAVIAGLVG